MVTSNLGYNLLLFFQH